MRTIGILGGMSCESTALYYGYLNSGAREVLGGLHSAECLIRSVDFATIEKLQAEGDWPTAGVLLARAAAGLERGGAEVIVLATNTMHKVAPAIESAIDVPLLHIADATAASISSTGFSRPGLMATAYTMQQDFYVGRLRAAGLEVLTPCATDMALTHKIIFEELCLGVVTAESRKAYEDIAKRLKDQGADSLILGCTEICMLLGESNSPLPVFDTTKIHCDAVLRWALRH